MRASNFRFLSPFYLLKRVISRQACIILFGIFYVAFFGVFVEQILYKLPTKIYGALTRGDYEEYNEIIKQNLVCCLAMTIICGLDTWMADRFSICLRERLDIELHRSYMSGKSVYSVNTKMKDSSGPGVRITEDVMHLTSLSAANIAQMIRIPIRLVYFGILTYYELGWKCILICTAQASASVYAGHKLLLPVSETSYQFENAHGEYLEAHSRISNLAEIICLSGAQDFEHANLRNAFRRRLVYQTSMVRAEIPHNFVTKGLKYFSVCLVFIMIYLLSWDTVERVMTDEIVQFISRSGSITLYLVFDLVAVMEIAKDLTKVCNCSMRVLELWGAIENNHESDDNDKATEETGEVVEARNIVVSTPEDRVLVKGLSFTASKGESLYIGGPSGVGKTSIFRVLSKLWKPTSGEIDVPKYGHDSLLILTQTPYLPTSGTFDEAVTFPRDVKDVSEDEIVKAAEFLRLTEIRERSDAECDRWMTELSSGEKQRVAMARILIHRPKFVLLDEATSANEADIEVAFFNRLRKIGVTAITISHNKELVKYHKRAVYIDKTGTIRVSDIS